MRIFKMFLLAAAMAVVTGCASTTGTERSVQAGELGCSFVPFAGPLCKEGIRKLAERRKDDMYQVLGDTAIIADINTPTFWEFKDDQGYMVIHSRSTGEIAGLGEFFVIEISYFLLIDKGVENIQALTLVAIPNPDASQMGEPAYIYLWR